MSEGSVLAPFSSTRAQRWGLPGVHRWDVQVHCCTLSPPTLPVSDVMGMGLARSAHLCLGSLPSGLRPFLCLPGQPT